LTQEVLPFWKMGWRLASFVLKFSFILKYMELIDINIQQTSGNFLSVATIAHAFRERGTAKYGMIILQKKTA